MALLELAQWQGLRSDLPQKTHVLRGFCTVFHRYFVPFGALNVRVHPIFKLGRILLQLPKVRKEQALEAIPRHVGGRL